MGRDRDRRAVISTWVVVHRLGAQVLPGSLLLSADGVVLLLADIPAPTGLLSIAIASGACAALALLLVSRRARDRQQARPRPRIVSYQMRSSFGAHGSRPGSMMINDQTSPWVMAELRNMGYSLEPTRLTSGPINAIWFDWEHGSFWGGSSIHGEDYGIAW